MNFVTLYLLAFYLAVNKAANLPTFTVTRQATVRFPTENTTIKPVEKLLDESPPPTTTTTTTTISPSKSVQVIGNYSIAVQHASKVKTEDEVEEIIQKTSSLLDLLDFLRQLPRETLTEILLGKDGNLSSTTESVLELLNDLRDHTPSTTTTSTTESTSTTTEKESTLFVEEENNTEDFIDEAAATTQNIVDEIQTIWPLEEEEELDQKNDFLVETSSIAINTTTSTTSPPPSTTSPIPPPPPAALPPPIIEYPRDYREQDSDASFAIGVAVGILACVVVASTGVTWCVCRRHWGRRNVYATMEVEEMPRAFTKPGPPVILPEECDHGRPQESWWGTACLQNNDTVSNRVTEL